MRTKTFQGTPMRHRGVHVGNFFLAEKSALVLHDLVLPGTDGIALMESLPELADLPVVFISGYGRDETLADGLAHITGVCGVPCHVLS